ncbi:hypothetical protein RDI58_007764 [Solanum bulbocastanum]|uniref:Uncharacterized protein n=1 Tax=Solanum bulbocastanum TaxID=147425 RepID=A0AAN8TZE1_SOLBU
MIHACIFDFRICYFEELFFMFHGKQQRSSLCPQLGDEVPVAPMNEKEKRNVYIGFTCWTTKLLIRFYFWELINSFHFSDSRTTDEPSNKMVVVLLPQP